MHTQTVNYEMFTTNGNYMVDRIVQAGITLAAQDGVEHATAWTSRELRKLSCAEGFEEADDTAVRQAAHQAVLSSTLSPFHV